MSSLLTVFMPLGMEGTVFEEVAIINGNRTPKRYQPRVHNGHVVVDIPLGFFLRALGGPKGELWRNANPEAMTWLGQEDRRTMFCNAFPGESRPAPLPPAAPAPIVMRKVRAPHGTTSYSHSGVEHAIGKDGVVTVPGDVADVLTSHGFVVVA